MSSLVQNASAVRIASHLQGSNDNINLRSRFLALPILPPLPRF
jgi:hypothetical protein